MNRKKHQIQTVALTTEYRPRHLSIYHTTFSFQMKRIKMDFLIFRFGGAWRGGCERKEQENK